MAKFSYCELLKLLPHLGSSLFSYAAFLDLLSHLDDTKMARTTKQQLTNKKITRPTSFIYYPSINETIRMLHM